MRHDFGGGWTLTKLDVFRDYLHAYRTIFDKSEKAKYFNTVYVDAFAGSGSFSPKTDSDRTEILAGSTRIALSYEPGFTRYLFVELHQQRALELESLKEEFPHHSNKIDVMCGNANAELEKFCKTADWGKSRALVFLDPYGMQVEWKVVEMLGRTQGVDLWYLFPIGAMNRLLTRDRKPPQAWADALTRILGTTEWEEAFYAPHEQQSLFDGEEPRIGKYANWDKLSNFVVERLNTAFSGVAPSPILLRNSHNTPMFMLCFACSNKKATELATKIANHVLKRRG